MRQTEDHGSDCLLPAGMAGLMPRLISKRAHFVSGLRGGLTVIMNGPSVGHGSPGGSEYRSQYDNGAVTPGELTGPDRRNCRGRQTAKMSSRYLSRDEVDGTRRARCGLGSGEHPVQGKIPWRSFT